MMRIRRIRRRQAAVGVGEKVAHVTTTAASSSSSSSPPCKKQRLNHHDSTSTSTSIAMTPSTTATSQMMEKEQPPPVDLFVTPVKRVEVIVTPSCDDGTVNEKNHGLNKEDEDCDSSCSAVATSPVPVSKKLNGAFQDQCHDGPVVANGSSSLNKVSLSSSLSSSVMHNDDNQTGEKTDHCWVVNVGGDKKIGSHCKGSMVASQGNSLDNVNQNRQCHNDNGNSDVEFYVDDADLDEDVDNDGGDEEDPMISPCKLNLKGSIIKEKEKVNGSKEAAISADPSASALEPMPCKSSNDNKVAVERSNVENVLNGDLDMPDGNKDAECALEKCCSVLNSIKTILKDNPLFCSNDRREEWIKEIDDRLATSAPKTTIGVLGNTGVGKVSYATSADWMSFFALLGLVVVDEM
jgi:hypothetical protein